MTKWVSLSLLLLFWIDVSLADEPFPPAGDESASFQVEKLLDGLHNPCGLVSRPPANGGEPSRILFVESGAGRVLELLDTEVGKTREVLTGLSVRTLSDELGLEMSGWRLGFVTPSKMAVLGGSKDDGIEELTIYILSEDGAAVSADGPDHSVAVVGDKKARPLFFPGMTFEGNAAYVSSGSSKGGGTIFRVALVANKVETPRPILYIQPDDELRWPGGSCLSPSGRAQFLVTGYLGELVDNADSRVTFVVPSTGEVAMELACELRDLVDVAYSPSGQLFAIDLSWSDKSTGGVYRIDDARVDHRPACRVVKIAEVTRPTSMLFGEDGALYVTSLGKSEGSAQGAVFKIKGAF